MSESPMTDWKQNAFGIDPDDWAYLVKLKNHGEYDAIWLALPEAHQNQDSWDQILVALEISDCGRCGVAPTTSIPPKGGSGGPH